MPALPPPFGLPMLFSGHSTFPAAKIVRPHKALPHMKTASIVMLQAMRKIIISEGIRDLDTPNEFRRISTLPKRDQLQVYVLRFLKLLSGMSGYEAWFATINISRREQIFKPTEPINSFYRRINEHPHYAGILVPNTLSGPRAHLHLFIAVPATWEGINRLVSYENHRNKIQTKLTSLRRSAHFEWIYDIEGLYNYLVLRRNLGAPDAKVIASSSVKSKIAAR